MDLRIYGAILIIAGCGSLGMMIAAAYRRRERSLRQFMECLKYMECDLKYRLTPLPELCRCTAAQSSGSIRQFFSRLVEELEDQISPDVECCVKAALAKVNDLPEMTRDVMLLLGKTLGRFDAEGQLKSLEAAISECERKLEVLSCNQDMKIRNYRTLGLCAGAALAILFV